MQTYERSWRNDKIIIDNKQFDHILKIKLIIAELDSNLMCTFTPGYSITKKIKNELYTSNFSEKKLMI